MNEFSRRDFLNLTKRVFLTASGLLGLGALARFLGYQTESSPPTEFDIGLSEAYPLGSQTFIADIPALLVHTEDGFSALSLTCTHLGCTLKKDEASLACPCHGSRFDEQGRVWQGPAKEGLPKFSVEMRGEHIIVHLL